MPTIEISWDDPAALASAAPELSGIDFLRAIATGELPAAPIRPASGEIRCEGQVVHGGSRIATAEGRVSAADGVRLLAHGTSTCLLIDPGGGGGG